MKRFLAIASLVLNVAFLMDCMANDSLSHTDEVAIQPKVQPIGQRPAPTTVAGE